MDSTSVQTAINGISHSGFYVDNVDNLDRTLEFYTKVLGARLAWRNDNSRVEVEARFTGLQAAADVMERGKANRREDMGLYGGDRVRKTTKV